MKPFKELFFEVRAHDILQDTGLTNQGGHLILGVLLQTNVRLHMRVRKSRLLAPALHKLQLVPTWTPTVLFEKVSGNCFTYFWGLGTRRHANSPWETQYVVLWMQCARMLRDPKLLGPWWLQGGLQSTTLCWPRQAT